jgi:hypothetical protein
VSDFSTTYRSRGGQSRLFGKGLGFKWSVGCVSSHFLLMKIAWMSSILPFGDLRWTMTIDIGVLHWGLTV